MFEWEEESDINKPTRNIKDSNKVVFTVGGGKGEGKTAFAMGLPGRIYTINFDGKALRVKSGQLYKNDKRITVLDGRKYIKHKNLDHYPEECEKTFRWVMFLLDEIEKRGDADWIHIDASDRMTKILEMKMRFKERLTAFQNFANRGLWNLRTFDLTSVHYRALNIARYGIVYTTFREIISVDEYGEEKTQYKPKWTEVIKEETDIYVEARQRLERNRKGKIQSRFFIVVVSSKIDDLMETGTEIELTGMNITKWLKLNGRFNFFKKFERPAKAKGIEKKKSKKKKGNRNLLD